MGGIIYGKNTKIWLKMYKNQINTNKKEKYVKINKKSKKSVDKSKGIGYNELTKTNSHR